MRIASAGAAEAVLRGVSPLPRLWETAELDVPAGETVVAACTDQAQVFVVLYGHGTAHVPYAHGQDAAYGVATGAHLNGALGCRIPLAVDLQKVRVDLVVRSCAWFTVCIVELHSWVCMCRGSHGEWPCPRARL